jgi:VanZ family protein
MKKHRKYAAFGLILLLAAFLLAHIVKFPESSVFHRGLQNSLHAPGFAAVTLILLFSSRLFFARKKAWLSSILLAGALAVLGELVQVMGSRDADVADLLSNVSGILVAAVAFFLIEKMILPPQPASRKALGVTLVIALAVGLISPTAWYLYALRQQAEAMPTLISFDNEWEKPLYADGRGIIPEVIAAPAGWPSSDATVAKVTFGENLVPGLDLQPFADWSDYEALTFHAAALGDEMITFSVRINDRSHNSEYDDRYNVTLTVGPVPKKLVIPLDDVRSAPKTREMDMGEISSLIFFAGESEAGKQLLFGSIRLE